MKKILFLGLTTLMVYSCASVQVNYDYDNLTDFSHYKTYNYFEDLPLGMNELDAKRFLDALDAGLQAKGLSLSDTPDFLVNVKSSTFQEQRGNNVGVGLGGAGRNVGGGISIGIPVGQAKMNQEIVFEFVDKNKSGLFWQAISESAYQPNAKPQDKEARFRAVVEKVLTGYPPKSKK